MSVQQLGTYVPSGRTWATFKWKHFVWENVSAHTRVCGHNGPKAVKL